jgi:hypothetical protein
LSNERKFAKIEIPYKVAKAIAVLAGMRCIEMPETLI